MARLSFRRARAGWLAVAAWLAAVAPAGARVFPDSPFSDKAAGTTAANFLKSPPSARADALSGAFSAAAEGAESLFWNPSGMARLLDGSKSDLTLGYSALLETQSQGAVGYARPFAHLGVFGVGLVYATQSSLKSYSSVGDPTGSFTPNDLACSFGYATRLGGVNVGAAAKLIRSQIAEASGMTPALDFGMQLPNVVNTEEGPIDVGASIANLGPPLKLGGNSDPLPFRLQAGALWHLSERIGAILDGFLPVDQDPYVAIGLEGRFQVGNNIRASARGGYNVARGRGIDGLTGMSAGVGLEFDRYRLDYAWVPFGELGTTNRLSFGVLF